MKDYLKKIIVDEEIKNWHFLVLFSLVTSVVIIVSDNYIYTREFYGFIYSKKYEPTIVDFLYVSKVKFAIFKYLFVPIVIVLRVVMVSMLIQFNLMIRVIEIPFRKIMRISLLGYATLSLMPLAQMLNLLNIPIKEMTVNYLIIVPFSLASLLNIPNINSTLVSILGLINIFEVLWIVIITFGLKAISHLTTLNSFIISFSVWSLFLLFQIGVILFTSQFLG